jgi:glutathione S-transferase
MELVLVVMMVALIEYMVFAGLVGAARGKYGIHAPATAGHPQFERLYRVHQNTLEALVIFIPALLVFACYLSFAWAAALGVAFILARALYAILYIRAPEKRGPGAGLTGIVNIVLVLGGLWGLGKHLL